MRAKAKNYLRKYYLHFFTQKLLDKKFCIFSNDCWAGEIYKITNREFNTPFIGLMLMAPCYIKFLSEPFYYFSLPLIFKNTSAYSEMNEIGSGKKFPLATLGNSNIEIHFLHYENEEIAAAAWYRRIKRIDKENIFVKFDCSKDYGSEDLVDKFLSLPYQNKLVFGNKDFGKTDVILTPKYSKNAVVQFYNCFQYFNPFLWVSKAKKINGNIIDRTFRKLIFA